MTKVGVAISTHRRPVVLGRALAEWAKVLPDVLVVNHDVAGDGVAATKNRGIAALMDAGCDHLFLADDDMWPISPHWSHLYVEDDEPQLMHCWGGHRLMADDRQYTTWRWPRGVLLYAERRVIERVGGMRLEFGRWGGEHVEWSQRIHNAGLTKAQYADLTVARRGVWQCLDYTRNHRSTMSQADRKSAEDGYDELFARFAGSTDFVEYERVRVSEGPGR